MTRKSEREIERVLEDLRERTSETPDSPVSLGADPADELLDAIEQAAEHRLENPEEPIPEEIADQLPPDFRRAFRPDTPDLLSILEERR